MVVYPEQVWYGHVTEADVDEIVEKHIIGGQFVERLMLPEQPHLNGATSGPALVVPPARPKAEKPSDPA
jgi:(2Fe-2S) ferredoxin